MLKFFSKKEVENSKEISDVAVTLKNGKEMTVSELIEMKNAMDEEAEAKKKKEEEEAEEAKKNEASEEEKKKKEEEEKKENEMKEEDEKKKKEEMENKKNEIKNAIDGLPVMNSMPVVETSTHKIIRGKSLYGSN